MPGAGCQRRTREVIGAERDTPERTVSWRQVLRCHQELNLPALGAVLFRVIVVDFDCRIDSRQGSR
jgi:hypothetical protein